MLRHGQKARHCRRGAEGADYAPRLARLTYRAAAMTPAALYDEMQRLGAPPELLRMAGSWGDALEDDEVLNMFKTGTRRGTFSCRERRAWGLAMVVRKRVRKAGRKLVAHVRARGRALQRRGKGRGLARDQAQCGVDVRHRPRRHAAGGREGEAAEDEKAARTGIYVRTPNRRMS